MLLIPGLAGSCYALAAAAPRVFPDFDWIPFDHALAGEEPGIEETAAEAAALLPDSEPAFICGESFGGPVALTLARRYPERVRGLILLSTFARHPSASRPHARLVVGMWAALLQRSQLLAQCARIAGMVSSFGRPVSPATIRTYLSVPFATGAEYRRRVRLLAEFDARPWLGEITGPSLVVVGRRDLIVPPRAVRELGSLLPGSTVRELPCGHLTHLAMPDRLRNIVAEWATSITRRVPDE